MALGRAYVAIAEGSDALTWNPAGLAVTQQKEFVYSYLRYIQEVDSPLYMAYAHPMGRTVWGANIAYLSVDGFDVRDTNGIPQDDKTTQLRDGFVSVGLARSFWYEKFFVGGALRVVHEGIEGAQVTSVHDTLVADVGFLLKPNNVLSLCLAIQNFGSSVENVPGSKLGGRLSNQRVHQPPWAQQGRRPGSLQPWRGFEVPEQYLGSDSSPSGRLPHHGQPWAELR